MFKCPKCNGLVETLECETGTMTIISDFDGLGYSHSSETDPDSHCPTGFKCPDCDDYIADTEDEAMEFWVEEKA